MQIVSNQLTVVLDVVHGSTRVVTVLARKLTVLPRRPTTGGLGPRNQGAVSWRQAPIVFH